MSVLSQIEPQSLFSYFEQITKVPRPSKREEKIRQYLLEFANKHKLEVKSDKIGNVIILKPGTSGMENAPTVVLQSHMDMVCEKNADKDFDFDNDPIEVRIDGDWVKANGTTLGADCGIGMAAQLALLASDEYIHGPLECLFTVDEETGLSGAFALGDDVLEGKILLNLDSEDEGELFIGCAGGIDTLGELAFERKTVTDGSMAMKIQVNGLLGGHSGDDIHKNRGNANKILNRILTGVEKIAAFSLADFDGGNLRNAIAREAKATIVFAPDNLKDVEEFLESFSASLKMEYQHSESRLKVSWEELQLPTSVMDDESKTSLMRAITACPHGVLEMSTRMEGMVETSTNLASVKFTDQDSVILTTSQRSEIESRKYLAADMVAAVFSLAGIKAKHTDGYPGWTPDPDSEILDRTVESYKHLFGEDPIVRSIHAGLECGLFLEKYPELDMVSFGPTIRGAHSPDERLHIPATQKFWDHLIDLLSRIK